MILKNDTFSRIEPYWGTKEYFIVYTDATGKEYLFENQFEHNCLVKVIIGRRRLHFDTEVTRRILY